MLLLHMILGLDHRDYTIANQIEADVEETLEM